MKEHTPQQKITPVQEQDPEFLMAGTNRLGRGDPLGERRPLLARGPSAMSVLGTVRLTDGDLVFVPPPTSDPRDPLNMKSWQKSVVVVVLCSFSAMTLSLIGGFGGIISFYIPQYMAQGESYPNITHLMTYPTLFMGIGNLIGMPVAVAVGRRVVILTATIVLIAGALLCAASSSLSVHFAGRMLIGLACGQSESVAPLIIQEIHFLHERARALMIQQSVQVVISAVWQLCASPIAQALSPAWWYYLGALIATVQFIVAIFYLPETKYPRDFQKLSHDDDIGQPCTRRPPLDFVKHRPRTWRSDTRLWIGTPEWSRAKEVYKQCLQFFCFPNMIWVICLCGLSLGINVAISTTYSSVLTRDPYNWPNKYISYANVGQIPVAILFFPLLGWANDSVTQWRARRNGGIHEPENRLILIALPIGLGILCTVLYGVGAQYPWEYRWPLYPIVLAGYFLAFTGTVITLTTYLLDSYPTRAGPALIVMCASRGILSCLVSFNVTQFIETSGWIGTFGAFGVATGVVGLFGVPVFIYGKRLRIFTAKWTRDAK